MSLQANTEIAAQHQKLLRDLKTTVEGLLNNHATYLWNIYGGLHRLHMDLEKIFKHGCRGSKLNHCDYWPFIQGLEWLQPDVMSASFSIESECKNNLPTHVQGDKASIWLYRNLENHSLSQKVNWLLSNKQHMQQCYLQHAFLCQDEYSEAMWYCLRAVELNQPSLVSEIKPKLYMMKCSSHVQAHRRCASFPDARLKTLREWKPPPPLPKVKATKQAMATRAWRSMPNLASSGEVHVRTRTCRTSCSATNPSTPQQKPPVRRVDLVQPAEEEERGPRSRRRRTFIDDGGGSSVLPMATGYVPRPTRGQSLTAFLVASARARGQADLDRENAHFSICEAVIAAFEQVKCSRVLDGEPAPAEESDDELCRLHEQQQQQRIRLRRRQKVAARRRRLWTRSTLNDRMTEFSPASVSSSSSNAFSAGSRPSDGDIDGDSDSEDGDTPLDVHESSTLQDDSELSLSMASLYSDSDIARRTRGAPDGAAADACSSSAEGVALALISKLGGGARLPRASDLEWLVTEEETHQALLPLPKSWPLADDDVQTPLRGTSDWAPPRPQIILTLHQMPCRKAIMERQCYRCAGCGTRVAVRYASKFRYCNYLGRYFCTGCHANQVALIPARIIHQWKFTRCTVSTFAYRLLEQMHTDPLFPVFQLNPRIGNQSRNLQVCKKYRHGLFYLKDYILTCRLAEGIQDLIRSERPYLFNDPDLYSLEDLVMVRTGELKSKLKYIVQTCCRHTSECELCTARGFICELCHADDVLFPWQMRIVSRCAQCGSCYHTKCWNKTDAPCKRCCRRLKT